MRYTSAISKCFTFSANASSKARSTADAKGVLEGIVPYGHDLCSHRLVANGYRELNSRMNKRDSGMIYTAMKIGLFK